MNRNLYPLVIAISLVFLSTKALGQGSIPNATDDDDYKVYTDSLKNTPYPWQLPIMGSKLRKLGFDLPYPNGVMFNYARSIQDLTVWDLNVGFSPNNLVNVDGIARFESIQADVSAYTLRYDFWLLPFLNVYAIGGRVLPTTYVKLTLPIELNFTVLSEGWSAGYGLVAAGGFGPIVVSADFTQAWTWIGETSEANSSIVANARVGHMFRFKHKPTSNVVVLVGAGYLGLNEQSGGDVNLLNLVGITTEDKQRASNQLDGWYNDLPAYEQEIFGGVYNGLSSFLNDDEAGTLYYEFKKKLYYPWSLSVGANYQINKRFQLTGIYSFLG
jgi:hypothetical protein